MDRDTDYILGGGTQKGNSMGKPGPCLVFIRSGWGGAGKDGQYIVNIVTLNADKIYFGTANGRVLTEELYTRINQKLITF